MKKGIITFLVAILMGTALAQQAVELKDSGYGKNKFKDSPKRIYIAQFRVNYQLLYTQEDKDQASRTLGGGYRGSAKASLTLAAKGIESTDLLEITNKLYQQYIEKLQQAGYTIVSADEAQPIKEFAGWERKQGGTLSEAQYPGFITVVPTGFEYFAKKTKDSGKEKSTFTDNSLKISKDIKATVVKVNILVPFVEDAQSGGSKMLSDAVGGLVKVVLRPYLRVEKDPLPTTQAFGEFPQTVVTYAFMESLGVQAISNYHLKKNLDIPGVFEDKKYKAVETASVDNWGTDIGALTIFNVTDNFLTMAQPVPCDAKLYKERVYRAANEYLEGTLKEFLGTTN